MKRSLFLSLIFSVFILNSVKPVNSEDELSINNDSGISGDGIGATFMYDSHKVGALESMDEKDDLRTSNTNKQWFKIYSLCNGKELRRDARPEGSESVFINYLAAVNNSGSEMNSSNRLSFSENGWSSNRVWTIRVKSIGHGFSPDRQPYSFVTNVSNRVGSKGNALVYLPGISKLGGGTTDYAVVEASCRYLTRPRFTDIRTSSSNSSLDIMAQPGSFLSLDCSRDPCSNDKRTNNLGFVKLEDSWFNSPEVKVTYNLPLTTNSASIRARLSQ